MGTHCIDPITLLNYVKLSLLIWQYICIENTIRGWGETVIRRIRNAKRKANELGKPWKIKYPFNFTQKKNLLYNE